MSRSPTSPVPLLHQWGLFATAALLAAGALAWSIHSDYRATDHHERQRLADQAQTVAQVLSARLQMTSDMLDAVRSDVLTFSTTATPRESLNAQLQQRMDSAPGTRSLLVIDANGVVISSNRKELLGNNFKGSARFQAISSPEAAADKLFVSEPFVTPMGNFSFSLGRRLTDATGQFAGYVLAIPDPRSLIEVLQKVSYASEMNIALIHQDGKVVARYPDSENVTGMDLSESPKALFWRHRESDGPSSFLTGTAATTGKETYAAMHDIAPPRVAADKLLTASVARETPRVFAQWRRTALIEVAAFLVALVLAAGALTTLQRRSRH